MAYLEKRISLLEIRYVVFVAIAVVVDIFAFAEVASFFSPSSVAVVL